MWETVTAVATQWFDRLKEVFWKAYESGSERFHSLSWSLPSYQPTQQDVIVLQLVAGAFTIVWIIFQFAWLRRLNESRLERHLEGTISSERDELADERKIVLARLARVKERRGIARTLLKIWAHLRLTLSLVMRVLSFGTTRGLADHNMLLLQVGLKQRARGIFSEVAREAIKKIKLYEDAIENKRLEAQNALIFAGRVALIEGRNAAAVASFKKAKNLRDDADARLLIGNQLAEAGDPEGAMMEYEHALNMQERSSDHSTKAELHRRIASLLVDQGSTGKALRELATASVIDRTHSDYFGMAKTAEITGMIYASRRNRENAARVRFQEALENYERVSSPDDVRRVRRRLRELEGVPDQAIDGSLVRLLERCSAYLLRLAERHRARARMRGA